jgi:hypothetical protein
MKLSLLFLLAIVITAQVECGSTSTRRQKTQAEVMCENGEWQQRGYDSEHSCQLREQDLHQMG